MRETCMNTHESRRMEEDQWHFYFCFTHVQLRTSKIHNKCNQTLSVTLKIWISQLTVRIAFGLAYAIVWLSTHDPPPLRFQHWAPTYSANDDHSERRLCQIAKQPLRSMNTLAQRHRCRLRVMTPMIIWDWHPFLIIHVHVVGIQMNQDPKVYVTITTFPKMSYVIRIPSPRNTAII